VDISIAPDDSKIYVNSYGDGTMRIYDVTNPFEGKLIHQVKLGDQANMVSTSSDAQRVYSTSSLLSQWDKPGDQWLGFLVPELVLNDIRTLTLGER